MKDDIRKRTRASYDDPQPFTPSLTVYEPERGLRVPVGFVRFWAYAEPKPKRVKRAPKRAGGKRK